MDISQTIEIAVKKNIFDYIKIAKLLNYSENDIKFVILFWPTVYKKKYFEFSEEMVEEWFSYKKSPSMMQNFYKKIIKNYEKDIRFIKSIRQKR